MGADLEAQPYEKGTLKNSFCRKKEGRLIVEVRNVGDAPVPKNTYTKVEWGLGGVYGVKEELTATANLGAGNSATLLEFECPKKCFVPDCEFYITVDSRNELKTNEPNPANNEDNPYNNRKKGICYEKDRPHLPDLVPEPYGNKKYFNRPNASTLTIQIKNQGTAIAKASKTKIKFDGAPNPPDIGTKELVPGESEELTVQIPNSLRTVDFKFTIIADSDLDVDESDEANNKKEDIAVPKP